MMDNYGYEDDYGHDPAPSQNKSLKGYQIIVIVLAVILAALSFLYFSQMNTLKKEYAIERDTLQNRLALLITEYDSLQTSNDTIAQNLDIERLRADSLMESLTKERNFSRAKIRQYEKELGTLREVMRTYVQQIDSLNTLNQQLISENIGYRTVVSDQRRQIEAAVEKADELESRVRQGAVITARDIRMVPLSSNDREVSRANRAASLRVDFTLSANQLANPGSRNIYVRIEDPSGYLLTASSGVFEYQGQRLPYSAVREVDYQNQDLPVSVYYKGEGITSGKYKVHIYMDGHNIGKTEAILR